MSGAARLLLVEDDESLGETLQERLRREGYDVAWVSTQADATAAWRNKSFDLILLDVGLPDGSGFDFARLVAKESQVPFLFVTAMNDAETRLEGYEIGAEEFIPKPFHLKELLLRVRRALEGRAASSTGGLASLAIDGGGRVEFESFRLIRADGAEEFLQGRDCELLRLLASRAPAVVSRDEILDRVWGEDKFPSHRTVDNAVVRLRQALGPAAGKRIRSVRGIGYQWI